MWAKVMQLIDAKPELLNDDGQIIVQINPIEWFEQSYDNFIEFDRRKYGDTELIFFEKPFEDFEENRPENQSGVRPVENDILN